MLRQSLQSKSSMRRLILLLLAMNSVILCVVVGIFLGIFKKTLSPFEHISLFAMITMTLMIMAAVAWFLLRDIMNRLWYKRDILNHATDGVARVSIRGELIYVNPSFCDLFNIKLDEVIGQHWQKLFAEQSIAIACHEQQNAVDTGKASFEAMAKGQGQNLFPIQVTIIHNKDNKNSGFYLYIKDLTTQKAAQKDARRKHQELRQLFDNLPIVVFYKDDANNILRANKLASDLLDKDIYDVEGKSASDIFPEIKSNTFVFG